MSDDVLLCSGCGRSLRADARFCGTCGIAAPHTAAGAPESEQPPRRGELDGQRNAASPTMGVGNVAPRNHLEWPSGTVPALAWVEATAEARVEASDSLPSVGVGADGRPTAINESEYGRWRVAVELLRAVEPRPTGGGTQEYSVEMSEGSAVVTDSALVISCVRGRSAGGDFNLERDGGAVVARWSHHDIQRISARQSGERVIINAPASEAMLSMRILSSDGSDAAARSISTAGAFLEVLAAQAASAQMANAAGDERARLISIVAGGGRERDGAGGVAVRLAAAQSAAVAVAAPMPAAGAAQVPLPVSSSGPGVATGTASGQSRGRSRPLVIALVAIAAVVIAAGSIGAFVLFGGGGGGDSPAVAEANVPAAPAAAAGAESEDPTAAAVPPPAPDAFDESEEPGRIAMGVNLTNAFIDNDSDYDPGNLCFGPGRNSRGITYLVIGGGRYEQDFVQCGSRAGAQTADGYYRFARRDIGLEPRSIINGLSGDLVVDETSRDHSAVVRWTVRYGDEVVCQGTARWGAPGTCTTRGRGVAVESLAALTIQQKVTSRSSGSIWAGIHHPVLEVEVPDRNSP